MKGVNKFQLNEATMIEAMEHWFVTKVFDPSVTVRIVSVKEQGSEYDRMFVVTTEERLDEK